MPQRFLRPGITTSAKFNALDWQAQSLFVRLITLVDDYGRFEAHPMILKSLAFPFNPEISCEQMFSLCEQLISNDLATFYEKDGKRFVQLSKWQEKARSHSRFPSFDDDGCKHLQTFDNKCSVPSPSPSPSPSPICPATPDVASISKKKIETYSPESRVALHYLNEKSGKHFRECQSSLEPINARLKEDGVEIEGVRRMIDRQCLKWKGTNMEEYLRPQTLFGKEKFDSYYAAKDSPIISETTTHSRPPGGNF